jgi:anaerobic ribonucleoside-triphosphate reductase activating protein
MTIWIAGCNRKCPGCHNPELADYENGKRLVPEDMSNNVAKFLNEHTYIKGITLSGGDPLDRNDNDLCDLATFIYKLKMKTNRPIDIWLYTGGVYERLCEHLATRDVMWMCDYVVDGPFEVEHRDISLAFRGSPNQRIIDIKKTLAEKHVIELDVDKED